MKVVKRIELYLKKPFQRVSLFLGLPFLTRYFLLCAFSFISLSAFSFSANSQEDAQLLFIDTYLDGTNLENPVEVLTFDFENYYFAVEEIAYLLELPITITNDNSLISGWFINEYNTININLSTLEYQLKSQTTKLGNDNFIVQEDILYIGANTLEQVFGITAKLRVNDLKVNFTSKALLPRQAKLQREKARKLHEMRYGRKQAAKLITDSYQWFTFPNIDISAELKTRRFNHKNTNTERLTINSSGDIGKHGSEIYYAHQQEQNLFRAKLYKELNHNNRTWYYELGDVNGISNLFTGGGGLGKGISFRKNSISNQLFATRRFEGNAVPGWEVELYRNGALISYQEVDENGRYLFDDVQVRHGKNNFKIVLYGPQGQQKEIEESFTGYALNQKAGQWTPEFSVIKPKERLLPLDFNEGDGQDTNLSLNYGITDDLQASVAWHEKVNSSGSDKSRYINSALRGSWQSNIFNIQSSHKLNTNDISFGAELFSFLWNHDWRLSYQNFNNDQRQKSQQLYLNVLGNRPLISELDQYSLNFSYTKSKFDNVLDLSIQHSANFDDLSFNSTLSYQDSFDNQEFYGNTGINYRHGKNAFRFDSQYQFSPKAKLERFSASYNRHFSSVYLQLRTNINQEQKDDISAQLSWRFNAFRLGTRLLVDEEGDYTWSLTFATGIATSANNLHFSKNSLKKTATIKASAFIDRNYNNIFDENEQAISGLKFKGNSAWHNKKTDDTGTVYLPEVQKGTEQKIEVNVGSLDDPFLTIDEPVLKVKAHAGGLNELYFPVYETVEIEGEVKLKSTENKQGSTQQAVPLLLINDKGQQQGRVLSEYDGFFVFEKVKPDNYHIVIEPEYLKRKQYKFDSPIQINMAKSEEMDSVDIGTIFIKSIEISNQ